MSDTTTFKLPSEFSCPECDLRFDIEGTDRPAGRETDKPGVATICFGPVNGGLRGTRSEPAFYVVVDGAEITRVTECLTCGNEFMLPKLA